MDRTPDTELHRAYDLYRVGQAIARQDKGEVQRKILEHIVSQFGASSSCIALIEKDKHHLHIVMGVGHPANFIGSTVKLGEGIMGWVAQQGSPLLLNGDVVNDIRFGNLVEKSRRPRSAMCWPLKVDDNVIGVLSINRDTDMSPFTEQDLEQGGMMINIISVVIDNIRLHAERQSQMEALKTANTHLEKINQKLQDVQQQVLHADKMASIGQLAAGVAHEINNPVGYINSNVGTLRKYVLDLFRLLGAYEQIESEISGPLLDGIRALKQELELNYLKEDTHDLIKETQEGITRVKQIVQDLKDFSHVGEAEWQWADLHTGIDSTLNIVHNELKYKADVIKEYGDLPAVECIASQLNQVFMNILVNAAHAIEDHGTITIRTGTDGKGWVYVALTDTGKGIALEHKERIFDPLFTTKAVGEGTGLGLSLSYSIVNKHGGHIEIDSQVGQGSTFTVWLPIQQAEAMAEG